jgi:hypothetical protein
MAARAAHARSEWSTTETEALSVNGPRRQFRLRHPSRGTLAAVDRTHTRQVFKNGGGPLMRPAASLGTRREGTRMPQGFGKIVWVASVVVKPGCPSL